MPGAHITFGFPTLGIVRAELVMALRALQMPLGASTSDCWVLGEGPSIADKRNAIVKQALNNGSKYVFFIGDDTLPPPHAFIRLMQQSMFGNRKIMTGLYTSRTYPPQPMIWRDYMTSSYYDFHLGELIKVDWAGCDCLLVDTDVFRSVPEPWFSQNYVFEPGAAQPPALATEDIYFYEKARKYGFEAWCDTGVLCIHQDRGSGMQFGIPADWPQAIPGSDIPHVEGEYLIADFGAGTESPFTPVGARLVRFDLNEAVTPDVRCDLRAIPEPDQKYDEIWSRHVLEHFSPAIAPQLIQEWVRVLKIGGKVRFSVPNFEQGIKAILAGPPTLSTYNWWQVYGQQATPLDVHHNGFTIRSLGKLFELAWGETPIHTIDADGFRADAVGCLDQIEVNEIGGSNESLEVTAVKVRHPSPAVLGPRGDFATEEVKEAIHV